MAPELNYGFSSKGYDGHLADMFALAVTFFITVFGIPPFHHTDDSDVYYKIFHQFTNEDKVLKFIRLHPATKPNKDFLID
jgi:serine/threonine protein kinase